MKTLFACIKIFFFALLCLITIPLQFMGMVFLSKTPLFYIIPKLFHGTICFIFGIRVKTDGEISQKHTIFVGNHLSYIDIPVLGSFLNATFISKEEVKSWPVLGLLGILAKTVFISRDRNAVEKCIKDIQDTLARGRSLILFPEGTSTKGETVIPFKSSVFEIFLNQNLKDKIRVQPFTISIERVNGRPVERLEDHDLYAWYDDMTLETHLWALAKTKGIDLIITFHPPLEANKYNHRKNFAHDCHQAVLSGLENNLSKALDFKAQAA